MYTLSNPSGILRKDGVEINQINGDPDYEEYTAWLGADDNNGPVIVYDPPPPEPTVTAAQVVAAFAQLNLTDATAGQLGYDVFNAARLL
jgi:hypothetical protein